MINAEKIDEIAFVLSEFAMQLADQFVEVTRLIVREMESESHLNEVQIVQTRIESGIDELTRESFYLSLYLFEAWLSGHRILAPHAIALLKSAIEYCNQSVRAGKRRDLFNLSDVGRCREYGQRRDEYTLAMSHPDPTNLGGTYWVFKKAFQNSFGFDLKAVSLVVPFGMRKVSVNHLQQFIVYLKNEHSIAD